VVSNKNINWTPEHIKEGRFGEWLAGAKDWAISRERYWGTPLPIWVNDAGEIIVVGSYQELSELAGKPEISAPEFDPHRPYVDDIVIVKDGKTYKRVKEVADCWFDSGCMPYAQHHVISDEQLDQLKAEGRFPANYIAEAIDQTRGWFYTLLAVAVLLEQETPYQNVICLGHINDKFGAKMSKSKGNIVDPWEVINTWGADALRLHLYSINQPGESKNFDIKQVEEVVKKNFMILLNVVSFYKMFAGERVISFAVPTSTNVLDQWLISLTNKLVKDVSRLLDGYDIFSASRLLSEYITELSTWYVRRSRERFKSDDEADKQAAIETLGWAVGTFAKVMAPFTPFISDHVYQQLTGNNESVHMQTWPEVGDVNNESLQAMEQARALVQLGLSKRDEVAIKVRQPLASMTVSGKTNLKDKQDLQEIIKDELNVKDLKFVDGGEQLTVELDTVIDEALQKEGIVRELVRQINSLRKNAKLTINDVVDVHYYTEDALVLAAIKDHEAQLLKQTGSQKLTTEAFTAADAEQECVINEQKVFLAVIKV
jgi:isoleucyl-tRNA synthetase